MPSSKNAAIFFAGGMQAIPGSWIPMVNLSACEGKRDCVDVCPYHVFEVRRIDRAERLTV